MGVSRNRIAIDDIVGSDVSGDDEAHLRRDEVLHAVVMTADVRSDLKNRLNKRIKGLG